MFPEGQLKMQQNKHWNWILAHNNLFEKARTSE